MKRSLWQLYELLAAIMPFFLLLIGGLGVIYCSASGMQASFFMGFSLLVLLVGVSLYTYQQVMKSKELAKRFGMKDSSSSKKKKKKHRRMGKRCPQCQRVIYHRRTVCQHCGYEFASHKKEAVKKKEVVEDEDNQDNEENASHEGNRASQ